MQNMDVQIEGEKMKAAKHAKEQFLAKMIAKNKKAEEEAKLVDISFVDIIMSLTQLNCQPNVIFITDTSMKLLVCAFVILAEIDEALKLLALGQLMCGKHWLKILKPRSARKLPSGHKAFEHALVKWRPFNVNWFILIIRRANDEREQNYEGHPYIRAAVTLDSLWKHRLDDHNRSVVYRWNDSRVAEDANLPVVNPTPRAANVVSRTMVISREVSAIPRPPIQERLRSIICEVDNSSQSLPRPISQRARFEVFTPRRE